MAYSQEYPYEINQYQEFERNPAYTLNNLTNNTIDYSHKGFLPGINKFNSDKISFKHYFEGLFSGAGVFFSRNQTNDSVKYTCTGISAAYRNILFDKVYVKLGLTYKFIYNNSASGIYDDFSFYANDSALKRNSINNFNASVAFTSSSDYYFISAGICNINPFGKIYSENSPFLVQYSVNAGNFFSLLSAQKTNYLSFTYLQNTTAEGTFYSRGYFSTLYTTIRLSRRTSLITGISGGYLQNKHYNIVPFIYYVKKKFILKLSTMFYIPFESSYVPYRYLPQLNIIIKL